MRLALQGTQDFYTLILGCNIGLGNTVGNLAAAVGLSGDLWVVDAILVGNQLHLGFG